MKNYLPLYNKIFYYLFCFFISSALYNPVKSQNINNYIFSTNQTGSLTSDLNGNVIDMNIGTTQLIGPLVRNGAGSGLVNFPNNFNCWFMGTRATGFSVSANGWLGLNNSLSSANFWLGSEGLRIAPLLLNVTPSTNSPAMGTSQTGKVHYKLVGTAPNRTFVVEYLNMTINATLATSTTNDATFQARVYEATGVIEFVYGSINISGTSAINGNIGFYNSFSSFHSVDATTQTSSTFTNNNLVIPTGVYNALSGGGTSTTRRAYVFTPINVSAPSALTFSQINSAAITLNWINNATTPNLPTRIEIYYRTSASDWISAGSVAPTINTYQVTGLLPSTNYLFRIVAVRESNTFPLDSSANTLSSPLAKSTSLGGSWKNPATWLNGVVPGISDSVVIADSAIVVIDTSVSCYKLTVGGGVSGTLIFESSVNRTLSVWESVTVNPGGNFNAGLGSLTTHQLNIGSSPTALASGSLINHGNFDMRTSAVVIVNFLGIFDGSISGSGTTDFIQITLNKGNVSTNRPILDITAPFTIQGNASLAFLSTHTAGILRISGNFTQSNPIYTLANYIIPQNGGLILNNPNFTIASTNGSPVCNGLLQITQGTFNVSQQNFQLLDFGTGAVFTVNGGTVNAAGRIQSVNAIAFNFSSGTINVATVGNSVTNSPSFGFTNANSIINWSGGTVNLTQRSTGSTALDYNMGPINLSNANFSGGILKIGTSSTTTLFDFRIQGDIPNLVFDSINNNKSALLSGVTNLMRNVTIAQGCRLNLNGTWLQFSGDSINNRGIVEGRTTGSNLIFTNSTANQVYSGTGADTLLLITNRKLSGSVLFNKTITTYGINFISSTPFINSNNIILGNGNNQAVTVRFGEVGFNAGAVGFDGLPTFNLGNGAYTVQYLSELTNRRTGFEIPANRTITNLIIINPNGVTLAGGNVLLTGTLTLISGILTTSDTATLHVTNTLASAVPVGSATSYIRGPLIRRYPASLINTNTYSYPIGNNSYKLIQLINTRTNAGGTSDIRIQYFDNLSGGNPNGTNITSLNPEYVAITVIAGTNNIDSTRLVWTQSSGLLVTNRLAFSTTLTGAYAAISNVPSGNTLTSNNLAGASAIQGFFSLAEFVIPLSGTYLIGANKVAPNYTSISAFTNNLVGRQVQGNIVLLLDTDYVSTTETFPIQLNAFYANNPNWTITIKPNIGVNAVISGTSLTSIIRIPGARNYIIDGSNNGTNSKNLTIQNLNTNNSTAAIWISSLAAGSGSSKNVIKNVRASCGADQTSSTSITYGVILSGTNLITGGNDNDSNQIINNEITRARFGIYSFGGSATNLNSGNLIQSNIIGSTTFGSNQIGRAGIVIREEENVVINDNEIRFIGTLISHTATGASKSGIVLGTNDVSPLANTLVKNAKITRNKIHDIVNEKTFSTTGILITSANEPNNTSNVIANNDIYSIRSNTSTGDITGGIVITAGKQDSILFNTISINGDLDPVGVNNANTGAVGLNLTTNTITNPIIRNNIITMDVTSNNTNLTHVGIRLANGFTWGAGLSNNNLFFPTPNNPLVKFGRSGTTIIETLSNWQAATGQDMASIVQDPLLNSSTISAPQANSPAIGAGITIPGYNRDLLDSVRSNPPTIGAYEKSNDLLPPVISFTNITNDTSPNSRTLTSFATINDLNGINNSSGFKPRIYFKKIREANVFGANNNSTNGWKWVEASNSVSPYSFTINYNLLFTPVSLNDTIQYFVVAQDNYLFPNVTAQPFEGFQASSINNIISAPINPPTYKIVLAPLTGNYFVGNAQTFPRITDAMLAAHERGIVSPVTFILKDTLFSSTTGETFPIEVRPFLFSSAINTVTIRPDSGITSSISDSINSPLFNLNGVNNFIISGVQNITGISKRLIISNRHVGTNASAVRFINDASNNSLNSAVLLGANAPTNGNAGVIVFSTGVVNGNDKNTINNCNIGNALTDDRPSTLIYSLGSSLIQSRFNDSNVVSNCFLYNFSNPSNEFNAIKIGDGNNAWTIRDNHIYQTTPITTSAIHYAFNFQSNTQRTALNNMRVLNNYIGGSAPFCAGSPWTQNLSSGTFISTFNMGNTGINEFKANKFCNIIYNITGTGSWTAISFQGGRLNIDSNIIGSPFGRDSLVILGSEGGTTSLFNLNTSQVGDHFIRGNTFGAIRIGSSSPTLSGILHLISSSVSNSSIKFNIIGNVFGNALDSNIRTSSSIDLNGGIRGIFFTGGCAATIRENIFRNFYNSHAGTVAFLHAVSIIGSIDTVVDNQIYNFRFPVGSQLNSNTTSAIIGIMVRPTTANNYIARNTIYQLAVNNNSTVSGIVINSISNSTIENNYIYNLGTLSGNAQGINGINYLGGSNNRIINNMIKLGFDTLGTNNAGASPIVGLNKAGGSLSAFFNSIYIGGNAVPTSTNNSAAFLRSISGTDSLMNNILVNVRSNLSSSGDNHFTVNLNNTTTLFSNYNLYWNDSAAFGDVLARIGTTNYLNLSSFRNATQTDLYSIVSNPGFISLNTNRLQINQTLPTPVEGSGIAIDGITRDFDGELRNNLTPTDIGADAGNFIPLDLTPPTIQYSNFTRDSVSAARLLIGQVSVTDISDIDTGAFKPRIYFKKKTNANVFLANNSTANGWKFAEATNTSSPFNFTINYTILTGGGIAVGDTIEYFVVAQDTRGNVASSPFIGLNATSVSSISTAPNAPAFYAIRQPQLRGTYLIGTTQTAPNYTSLTQAINALNSRGIDANVIFELRDTLYTSPIETFPLTINQIEGADETRRLTIKPGAGITARITANVPGSIFILNGADFVTIDGSNNGSTSRNLTISNTNNFSNTANIWCRSSGVALGAKQNIFKNLNIQSPSNFGIGLGGLNS
nr:fibronectin type III domain-containing protein [Bacteroidia bacterium]